MRFQGSPIAKKIDVGSWTLISARRGKRNIKNDARWQGKQVGRMHHALFRRLCRKVLVEKAPIFNNM